MEKIIICVAPVGYWGSGDNNPLTPHEIATETIKCYEHGASMVHLHVRDEYGNATTNLEAFKTTVNLIKEKCDIIIQGSTGGSYLLGAQKRSAALNVPDVEVSTIITSSHNIFNVSSINTQEDVEYWAGIMKQKGIVPEISVFEIGMVDNSIILLNKGLLELGKYYYNFSLGFPGSMSKSLKNLSLLIESIDQGVPWFYTEFGTSNFCPVAKAISLGGNVRVGFEDNIYLEDGIKSTSNVQLVQKVARISKELGRSVATSNEARKF